MYDYGAHGPNNADRARDRAAAARWAAEVVADPSTAYLDIETTGLLDPDTGEASDVRIIQIAVASTQGALLDTLVNPGIPIPAGATKVNGIIDADVAGAPDFDQVLTSLTHALTGRRIIIYKAAYDTEVLRGEVSRHYANTHPATVAEQIEAWFEGIRATFECAMLHYAAFCGRWNHKLGRYARPKLPGGDHTALGDCRATWRCVQEMAGTVPAPITQRR